MRPATSTLPSNKVFPAFAEFDRDDWARLEDAWEPVDSIEGLRAITGRGWTLLGSMLVGEMGGEGMVGADTFRS